MKFEISGSVSTRRAKTFSSPSHELHTLLAQIVADPKTRSVAVTRTADRIVMRNDGDFWVDYTRAVAYPISAPVLFCVSTCIIALQVELHKCVIRYKCDYGKFVTDSAALALAGAFAWAWAAGSFAPKLLLQGYVVIFVLSFGLNVSISYIRVRRFLRKALLRTVEHLDVPEQAH